MESYEVFIQRHISQFRQHNIKCPVQHEKDLCKTNDKCGSEITFYGCAILSPVLSLEQREEMCRYRAVAKCLMSEKTVNSHTVHTSVQINPSPTLKESVSGQEACPKGNTGRISSITANLENKEEVKKYTCSPVVSSTGLTDDWEVEDLRYPFIRTACDVSPVASHEGRPTVRESCEGLEIQHLTFNSHSDVHHQVLGYMSHATPVNTSSNNDRIDKERFGGGKSFMCNFALQQHAHTISQEPSIINYVQMDSDTLEECVVTPSQVDGSQQAYTDQTSCLSIVCPSEGPWKQQTPMQDRSTELPVGSPAVDDSLSDKENEEVSKEDFVGRGEHKRTNRKRQEQGSVPTPEPEKGQFDGILQIIPSENVFGNQKDFTPAFTSCSPRKSSCFFRKKSSSRGTQKLSFTTETFKNVPMPQLCLSPVHFKKSDGVINPSRKQEISNSSLMASKSLSSWNDPACQGSGNKSVVTRDITLGRSVNQTQQIAQLELNLSSLKNLISDLESSLSETQTDFEESTEVFSEYSCHDHSSPDVIKKSRVNRNAYHTTHSFLKQPVITSSGYEAMPGGDHELIQLHQAIPQDAFQVAAGECQKPLLDDVSSKPEQERNMLKMTGQKLDVSMNQSYDVESPSRLLLQAQISGGKQFTQCPDSDGVFFHTKRRLIMKAVDSNCSASADQRSGITETSPPSTIKP
ncbi:uncharacterized protein cp110 [Sardina pilchardus]|uniref:uncharacterized protein cp110 n=1 Tax=Sardina pilchardus TaxID=27697 RepID=UPI002E14ED43